MSGEFQYPYQRYSFFNQDAHDTLNGAASEAKAIGKMIYDYVNPEKEKTSSMYRAGIKSTSKGRSRIKYRSSSKKKGYTRYKNVNGMGDVVSMVCEDMIGLQYDTVLTSFSGYYDQDINFSTVPGSAGSNPMYISSPLPYLGEFAKIYPLYENVKINAIVTTITQPLMSYTTPQTAFRYYSAINLLFNPINATIGKKWDPFYNSTSQSCPAIAGATTSRTWKPTLGLQVTTGQPLMGEWMPTNGIPNIGGFFQVSADYSTALSSSFGGSALGIPVTVGCSTTSTSQIYPAGIITFKYYIQLANRRP